MSVTGKRILVTGSSGLVGHALCRDLAMRGAEVNPFDIAASGDGYGDITDTDHVRRAVRSCDGIIHLAAVSRVITGQRDPDRCWATNVGGMRNLLDALAAQSETVAERPWLIFASSREVYGQPEHLPVDEDTPLCPVNIYGRSKLASERMAKAPHNGIRTAIIRLSNVYGSVADHEDRVIPAFVRAAVTGAPLRVEGEGQTFDFTNVEDVSRGIVSLADKLASETASSTPTPPIHFVAGRPVTLGELATSVISLAKSSSLIDHAPPRDFDVARFCGSPARAYSLLGWQPQISLEEGLARLIDDMRDHAIEHGTRPTARIAAAREMNR